MLEGLILRKCGDEDGVTLPRQRDLSQSKQTEQKPGTRCGDEC